MKPGDRNMSIGKNKVKAGLIVLLYLCGPVFFSPDGHAQEPPLNLNLQTVIDMAVENNRLLGIKRMQIDERKQKVNEERVKYFPAVIAGSSYQYNSDRAYETVPKGSFGQLPLGGTTIELPATDKQFALSDHDQYVAGAAFYQPILQIPKIKTGVDIAKTDVEITNIEYSKAVAQTKQAAERLYFGLLILQKQKEEANIRLSSAQLKLHDIDSALLAGKTTASSKIGLSADVADEEQNLLKVKIQINNYEADLKHLTGLPPSSSIVLDPVSVDNLQYERLPVEHYIRDAQTGNNDLKLAELHKIKSEQAITAGKYGDLPEFGIIGGHTYQEGNDIYPQNNTFIGLSFKWNFQDLASNSYVKKQRMYLKRQAEEHMINTREQVSVDIEKAYRKLMEASELIALSKKVVDFRREDFKIQRDRHDAGLNLESDFLTAKAALIKSESDLLAAQLNYRMAVTDLQMLTFSDIF
jgi:outer membrane protein TolC